ncbi:hydroxyisourate hydrolase [Streptomyces albipurpureus]|uniref:5-hydroxyisourate hydrolase n=1 Tax=Streptomyces albipurpureus TaxID=2897419 RepID=A0ABT0UWK1_9ACTN|nr:hydroxyisourate hydrolase [Streptomyces sp. CWNU-1]MCM2392777.1 hydroxyisourate hydrolase [Streptomyces sp. CWNU-1]
MSTETTASVSTHILDTSKGRPAVGVAVSLATRSGPGRPWQLLGGSTTDADGRCTDLPVPPKGTTQVRLEFQTGAYFSSPPPTVRPSVDLRAPAARQDDASERESPVFLPEVVVVFAITPGEHYHVPLLLTPFGYSVYRGS